MAQKKATTRKRSGNLRGRANSVEFAAKSRTSLGRQATGKTILQELLTLALGALGLAGTKKLVDSPGSTLASSVHIPSTTTTVTIPSIPLSWLGFALFAVVGVAVLVVAMRLWLRTLNLQLALDSLYSTASQLAVMRAASKDGQWFTRADVRKALTGRGEVAFLRTIDHRIDQATGEQWEQVGFWKGVLHVLGLGTSVAGLLDQATNSTIQSFVDRGLIFELPPKDFEVQYCVAPASGQAPLSVEDGDSP